MAEVEIFKLFVLVMVRVGGMMATAPVLGSTNFPMIARVGFTALVAMLITPVLPALQSTLPAEPMNFAVLAAGEMIIGLSIGFVMTMAFSAIQLGGQIMDMQAGFGMMNVFNPALETQFPIFGFFLFILGVLYLLLSGGHRIMIWALFSTYQHIPVGGFAARPELLYEVTRWGQAIFVDGVMIAAPIAAAMLLAYVTMGLLGRVVPQIHLFVVGFPVTIATALFLIGMSLGLYLQYVDGMFGRMFQDVDTLIRGMS